MRKHIFALALIVPLIFSGCDASPREFSSITPHFKQNKEWQNAGDYAVESLADITPILESLIASGKTEGVIWFNFVNTGIEPMVEYICAEVKQNYPIAAFAVERISFDISQLAGEMRLRIDIGYSRPQRDIYSIKQVYTRGEFVNEIRECLMIYENNAIVMVGNYGDFENGLTDLFFEAYYDLPDYSYGIDGPYYDVYPDSGEARIIEIHIDRLRSVEAAKNMTGMVSVLAKGIIDDLPDASEKNQTVGFILNYLSENVTYDEESARMPGESEVDDSRTPFGALVGGRAVSHGYAMAFKKLCNTAGIGCTVVSGFYKGTPHAWNIVLLDDGGWYHVDSSLAGMGENPPSAGIFFNDARMEGSYEWDRGFYLVCDADTYLTEFAPEALGVIDIDTDGLQDLDGRETPIGPGEPESLDEQPEGTE